MKFWQILFATMGLWAVQFWHKLPTAAGNLKAPKLVHGILAAIIA
jgi:hypothetical protein